MVRRMLGIEVSLGLAAFAFVLGAVGAEAYRSAERPDSRAASACREASFELRRPDVARALDPEAPEELRGSEGLVRPLFEQIVFTDSRNALALCAAAAEGAGHTGLQQAALRVLQEEWGAESAMESLERARDDVVKTATTVDPTEPRDPRDFVRTKEIIMAHAEVAVLYWRLAYLNHAESRLDERRVADDTMRYVSRHLSMSEVCTFDLREIDTRALAAAAAGLREAATTPETTASFQFIISDLERLKAELDSRLQGAAEQQDQLRGFAAQAEVLAALRRAEEDIRPARYARAAAIKEFISTEASWWSPPRK